MFLVWNQSFPSENSITIPSVYFHYSIICIHCKCLRQFLLLFSVHKFPFLWKIYFHTNLLLRRPCLFCCEKNFNYSELPSFLLPIFLFQPLRLRVKTRNFLCRASFSSFWLLGWLFSIPTPFIFHVITQRQKRAFIGMLRASLRISYLIQQVLCFLKNNVTIFIQFLWFENKMILIFIKFFLKLMNQVLLTNLSL